MTKHKPDSWPLPLPHPLFIADCTVKSIFTVSVKTRTLWRVDFAQGKDLGEVSRDLGFSYILDWNTAIFTPLLCRFVSLPVSRVCVRERELY